MANVLLSWVLPTPSSSQRPIDHVRIEARVQGIQEWTPINQVPSSSTELLLEAVDPGEWEYQGIVVDTDGREDKNPKRATVVVPFNDPSPLETFNADLA